MIDAPFKVGDQVRLPDGRIATVRQFDKEVKIGPGIFQPGRVILQIGTHTISCAIQAVQRLDAPQ